MIVIDMDIPKCCGTCNMSGTGACKEWMNFKNYDMGQKRADTCPIKCDIEDIKAEIEEMIESYVCDKEENTMKAQGMLNAMRMTFDIIDKYTKGDKE